MGTSESGGALLEVTTVAEDDSGRCMTLEPRADSAVVSEGGEAIFAERNLTRGGLTLDNGVTWIRFREQKMKEMLWWRGNQQGLVDRGMRHRCTTRGRSQGSMQRQATVKALAVLFLIRQS
jgi:hypothetical protein